ncbi:MAG TPA: flagellar basal body P-ring formation chaperone FlgA [Pseudomonadales bacterium]
MRRQAHQHLIPVLLLALAPFAAAADAGGGARSLAMLLADAERMLERQAREAYPTARIDAQMQTLDPRLDLPPCDDAELTPRGQQRHGRIAVAVRCEAPQPWSIFLTGDVRVSVPVVVTLRPIRRGEVIDASMLAAEERELGELRDLFYTDLGDVVGQQARRHLAQGEVVLASQLARPIAVERGSKVQIVARRGAVEITGVGEALSAGEVGSQVRVRNQSSGRIVHAWVTGPGRVSTTPVAATGSGQ